jgi:hypothetical protein
MKWHLTVTVDQKKEFEKILHKDKILLMGSCFSEHISQKLAQYKFQVVSNPFGVLYHPKPIEKALRRIIDFNLYAESDLSVEQDVYYSLDHHSRFNHADPGIAISQINESIGMAHQQIKQAKAILITFGTAYYYRLKSNHQVVGNCHKLPDNQFEKIRDTAKDIIGNYLDLIQRIGTINPKVQIIFTVSPVRHWKNGAADNSWSKAILMDAVRSLAELVSNVHYFPSYEIMMDELRDYRFYKEDLLHPNDQAIEQIWQRFKVSCIAESAVDLLAEIEAIIQAAKHKPLQPNSIQHQKFIATMVQKAIDLQQRYDYLNFEKEINELSSNL